MGSFVEARRERAARAWGLADEVVLVGAGGLVPIPGSGDQAYPFRVHPEYRYLTDRDGPGEVLAFDPAEGWAVFVPEVTRDERVWTGAAAREGRPLAELDGWRKARRGRRLANLGARVCPGDARLAKRLREGLKAVRRPKDASELERIRAAAAATAAGFARLPELLRPGVTERRVQVELEAEFFRHGADRTAYDTIVGTGPNAAALHSTPSGRALGEGELALVDAGAEVGGYCADVTRTFVRTAEQRALHDVVLEAEVAAVRACRAGAQYRDIHMRASVDLARGLVSLGLLRGDPEGLVERDAHALFFPHGIGHMVGLGVRDGDSAPRKRRSRRPGLRFLRLDCALEPGYVVTIEPGIYFIPALLNDPESRERYAECVDWARAEALLPMGGVRIEDNVHVTGAGPEVLTAAIPK